MQKHSHWAAHWAIPPMQRFCVGIPTCWYLKMLKSALPPTETLKFASPPKQTPNANWWNIGHVGSPMQNSHVGHVDFMLFVSLSLFQWNMGFRLKSGRDQPCNTCMVKFDIQLKTKPMPNGFRRTCWPRSLE